MDKKDNIVNLLNNGRIDEAIQLAESFIAESDKPDDRLYYLLGIEGVIGKVRFKPWIDALTFF